jgi:hypothetical protein
VVFHRTDGFFCFSYPRFVYERDANVALLVTISPAEVDRYDFVTGAFLETVIEAPGADRV